MIRPLSHLIGGSAAVVGAAAGVVPEEEGCFSVSFELDTFSVGCTPVEAGALVGTDCALVALYGGAVFAATDEGTVRLEASKVTALVVVARVAVSVLVGCTASAVVSGALIVDGD